VDEVVDLCLTDEASGEGVLQGITRLIFLVSRAHARVRQKNLSRGFFCLGCCWMLMALLFVGGIMNLAWIAGIALLVLIEKTLPWGRRISRLTGAVLVVWGAVTLAAAA
jgi:predicted metal-binding membrane protein